MTSLQPHIPPVVAVGQKDHSGTTVGPHREYLRSIASLSRGSFQLAESQGFGDRLSWAIRAAGMTQRQFAPMIGVAETQISQWKTAANPDMETLGRISTLLGVSIDWLVHGPSVGAVAADLSVEVDPTDDTEIRSGNAAADAEERVTTQAQSKLSRAKRRRG